MAYETLYQTSRRRFSQWAKWKNCRLFVACCHCGAVHEWQIKYAKGAVYLRTRGCVKRTKERRRWLRKS